MKTFFFLIRERKGEKKIYLYEKKFLNVLWYEKIRVKKCDKNYIVRF